MVAGRPGRNDGPAPNGASRNPYHAFALLDLRIDGYQLLSSYNAR
jgi:hypothetical protein